MPQIYDDFLAASYYSRGRPSSPDLFKRRTPLWALQIPINRSMFSQIDCQGNFKGYPGPFCGTGHCLKSYRHCPCAGPLRKHVRFPSGQYESRSQKPLLILLTKRQTSDQDGNIGSGSRIAIVSFADSATANTHLITSVANLKSAVDSLDAGGLTNHGDAFFHSIPTF